jgi:hypothetical protein
MAAQARLSCPVRCAAISLGPILPRQPKPPGQKNNRTHLRGKKPELLMAKQLTKNHPCQFSRFGVQFSPIRELKRLFRAISRAIRDNSRQLALIRDKTFCGFRFRVTGLPSEARRAKEGHEHRFCKTKPICKNAKQPQTYAYKGLMKQLPRATAEKTKPICKNEKMNLTFCLKMTYEEKCPLRLP